MLAGEKMAQAILVIDTGSSSMRGVLFDASGKALHISSYKYTMTVQNDGSATMDAQIFSTALLSVCTAAREWADANTVSIRAIALDSQRSSVLPVSADMKPLAPILMWYDSRCDGIVNRLSTDEMKQIYSICGMHPTHVSSAPKMRWLKENEPETYYRADKLIGIHDYLLWQISHTAVTDAGCACRSALMDIQTADWSDRLISMFGLEKEKLLPIMPSGSVIGMVCPSFSELSGLGPIPVISSGGDQQCCVLGQGISSLGTLSVNSGSASYIAAPICIAAFDPRQEVNLSYYCQSIPYVLEASNMGSGTINQWFNQMFYHDGAEINETAKMDQEVENEPAGANGVICFPDFAGRGCPYSDPEARGLFINVGLQNTRASFARAMFEGICFDVRDCVSYMSDLGADVVNIQSTGGLTNIRAFNQMMADIVNLPVTVCREKETTALGALVSALIALGEIQSPADFDFRRNRRMDAYLPNERNVFLYQTIAQKREDIRQKLNK